MLKAIVKGEMKRRKTRLKLRDDEKSEGYKQIQETFGSAWKQHWRAATGRTPSYIMSNLQSKTCTRAMKLYTLRTKPNGKRQCRIKRIMEDWQPKAKSIKEKQP